MPVNSQYHPRSVLLSAEAIGSAEMRSILAQRSTLTVMSRGKRKKCLRKQKKVGEKSLKRCKADELFSILSLRFGWQHTRAISGALHSRGVQE